MKFLHYIFRERQHVNSNGFTEFCIRNIDRHALGRREIELAEVEMPGILALKQKAKSDQPLKGAKIVGCTHINAQSAVYIGKQQEIRQNTYNILFA